MGGWRDEKEDMIWEDKGYRRRDTESVLRAFDVRRNWEPPLYTGSDVELSIPRDAETETLLSTSRRRSGSALGSPLAPGYG